MFITQRGLVVDKQHSASSVSDQAHAGSYRRPFRSSCGAPVVEAQAASAVGSRGVCLHDGARQTSDVLLL